MTSKGIRLSLVKVTSPWQLEEKTVDRGVGGGVFFFFSVSVDSWEPAVKDSAAFLSLKIPWGVERPVNGDCDEPSPIRGSFSDEDKKKENKRIICLFFP